MKRILKAAGSRVLVMPMGGKVDESGRPISDGGLFLGREVQYPFGVVVSVGPDADPTIEVGDKLFWKRDLGTEFVHDGIEFNSLRTETSCKHCGKQTRTDEVIAKVIDEKESSDLDQASY